MNTNGEERKGRAVHAVATPNYWITTHHPKPNAIPWYIFLKKRPKLLPADGERVFFYETIPPAPGEHKPGRGAIVCKALVSAEVQSNRFDKSQAWPLMIPCQGHQNCSIPRDAVEAIVAGPFFRNGLRRITAAQALKLEAACPGAAVGRQ